MANAKQKKIDRDGRANVERWERERERVYACDRQTQKARMIKGR